MTQEQKAKAYDEALKKAREFYNEAKEREFFTIMSDYEEIFPVLKESEDERIRKRIRLCLDECVYSDIIRDYERDECLAYLEREKEQKPLTIESAYEKFVNPETLKEARTNKYIKAQLLWELMHNGIITEADYQYLTDDKRKPWTAEEYSIAYQKGFDMSEQLKQEEQKPEWGEEEERKLQKCIKIVERWEEDHDIAYAPYSGMLKSLRP